jgi:hypothetical protein
MDRDYSIEEIVLCLQVEEKEARRLLNKVNPAIDVNATNPYEKVTRQDIKALVKWVNVNAPSVGKNQVGWYLISLKNLLNQ